MSNYTFQNAEQALTMIRNNQRTDPYVIQVIEFLVERVQALERAQAPQQNCPKCGSILQKQTDGDLGCQRCDVEEIFSHYKQDEHEDALSKIVNELEQGKDVTMKRYDAAAVSAIAAKKPTNIESIHGDAYIDITINGSRRKAALASDLTYETIIVSYDPSMAAIEPFRWPEYSIEFKRKSGDIGFLPLGASLKVSPDMAITINRVPAVPAAPVKPVEVASTGTIAHGIATDFKFKLDRDEYRVHEASMTGLEIKRLLKNDAKMNYALYIEEPSTGPDYAVADDERVVVTGLIMYTVPPATFGTEQPKQEVERILGQAVEIIVNADKETLYFKDGEPREITYEQVIRIACDQIDKSKGRAVKPPGYDKFPQMSVTYQHKVPFEHLPGERDGSLWVGKKVAVTPGMIINAYCT
jgi:uncharacterized Zn finger protein (UPF0148 family)